MKSYKQFLKLRGRVQHYPWGKKYSDSIIPALIGEKNSAALDREAPWAELWFGAHPSGPASVDSAGEELSLASMLAADAEDILGKRVHQQFSELPFLFKLLSVSRPLSIQAHPDKVLAEKLHTLDSLNYRDDNHKPEMAMALTPCSLLYGFRSAAAISVFLEQTPELASLVGIEQHQALRDGGPLVVRAVYESVLRQTPERIAVACKAMYKRLAEKEKRSTEEEWILRIADLYPQGDPGLFSFFVLNLETLAPGEVVFIGPNIPHAYLEGDLVECMANSDNVVRAGLTGKFKDVDTLIKMIEIPSPAFERLSPTLANGWQRYVAPAQEFMLEYIETPGSVLCHTGNDVQLLFCVAGDGELVTSENTESFTAGDAFLVPGAIDSYQLTLTTGRVVRIVVP